MNKINFNWSKILPHIGIIFSFLVLSFIFFSSVLEGKRLKTNDVESWAYFSKETTDYNKTHDEPTLWTNSQFGGMPTYQIAMPHNQNIMNRIYYHLLVEPMSEPVLVLFLYLTCFYILLICLGCNKWLAVVGSLACSFGSYNLIIIAAGHITKAKVIAFMAPLIGSIWLAFRKDKIIGSLLTVIFLNLAIGSNHVQILYYTLFILVFFGIVELIYAIKERQLKNFFQTSGLLFAAAIIAIGANATLLYTTYEYSKYTMRGDSNGLTKKEGNDTKPGGLDKDYITAWSYGIDESFTMLIPDFKGGASGGTLSAGSETGKELKKMGYSNVEEMQLPLYWGTQPFTSGPVYLGAIVCFLFVLGFCLVDNRTKWWLLPVIVLTLMLSWGRNFMPLTDFFIDYIPLYNKFRTVSMILVATGLCMSIMAFLGLRAFLKEDADKQKNKRALYVAAGVAGGLCLIFWLIPSLSGNFISQSDAQLPEILQKTLPVDRASLLRSDAFRSLVFIVLAGAILWFYNEKRRFNIHFVYALLAILVLADLWTVDKRYLNDANFEKKSKVGVLQPSEADKFILQDKSTHRVLDITVNIFNDAKPSYFHHNIGGYHAAKLSRYQDLIDYHLANDIQKLLQGLNTARTREEQENAFRNAHILNMLNMKYLIHDPKSMPIVNPAANGNAWLVSSYRIAGNADEEMLMLGQIDTRNELVADKLFAGMLTDINNRDTTAAIELLSYAPNKLVYAFSSQSDQIAVFSEIFYDKGWNAYINGEKVPYFRADYLLRAMPLKAGNYTIEFKFEPQSFLIGNAVATVCSVLFIVLLIGYVVFRIRKRKIS
ncbi:MAG: YfhO family protein [Prevotellaceae bacterium]|nr:YfhO family protein [Prevotellaceae bacterium]